MREASLTLAAELDSIGQARQFLRAALDDWAVEGYDVGAPQVLTELATNAALHARSAYTVHLRLEPNALLIEVTDASPALPQQRHYGTGATTGRGIAIVEALSDTWGVEASPTGKTVWCRVFSDDRVADFAELEEIEELGELANDDASGHAASGPGTGRVGSAMVLAA